MLMASVGMWRWLVVLWRLWRYKARRHGVPRPQLQQRRDLHLRMARFFQGGVGVAGANGFYSSYPFNRPASSSYDAQPPCFISIFGEGIDLYSHFTPRSRMAVLVFDAPPSTCYPFPR